MTVTAYRQLLESFGDHSFDLAIAELARRPPAGAHHSTVTANGDNGNHLRQSLEHPTRSGRRTTDKWITIGNVSETRKFGTFISVLTAE